MTVSTTTNRIEQLGTSDILSFPFKVFSERDLKVYKNGAATPLALETDYTVAGVGEASGGSITLADAPESTDSFLIVRVLDLVQETSYPYNDPFPSSAHEAALDYLTMVDQQQQEELGRCLKLEPTDDSELPSISEILGAATSATASAAAASSSASAAAASAAAVGLPGDITGQAGNYLKVKDDEAGYEFTAPQASVAPVAQGLAFYADFARVSCNALLAMGVVPTFFNQQWGGPWFGQYPDGSDGEAWFEGYLKEAGNSASLAASTGTTSQLQTVKVSHSGEVAAIWLKVLSVTGSPTMNFMGTIRADSSGPGGIITNGSGTAVSAKQVAPMGWMRLPFPAGSLPSVVAGSTYHVGADASVADGSNYVSLLANNSGVYPHGNRYYGDAVSSWTPNTGKLVFLVEYADGIIQNGNLTLAEGNPLDQSRAVCIPAKWAPGFIKPDEITLLWNGTLTMPAADRTVLDLTLGRLDANRVLLTVDANGHLSLRVWESNGALHGITDGGTDVTGSETQIAIHVRAKGDGADVVELLLAGLAEGAQLSGLTLALDDRLAEEAVLHLGGFPTVPTWGHDLDTTAYPSTQGWTTSGSATESAAAILGGDALRLSANGQGAYYLAWYRSALASNATGNSLYLELAVLSDEGCVYSHNPVYFRLGDGTHQIEAYVYTDRLTLRNTAGLVAIHYADMTKRHAFLLTGRGNDCYLWIDGRLVYDGTGKFDWSAGNNVAFGSGTTAYQADSIWYRVALYGGVISWNTASQAISELALSNADLTPHLADLAASGKTLAEYAGVHGPVSRRLPLEQRRGETVTPALTTTSAELAEMSAFVLTDQRPLGISFGCRHYNNTAGKSNAFEVVLDGRHLDLGQGQTIWECTPTTAGAVDTAAIPEVVREVNAGLHVIQIQAYEAASSDGRVQARFMTVEGK